MARIRDQPFGVHLADAERGARLGAAARERFGKFGRLEHAAHAATAAPGHRLEHQAALRVGAALLGEEGLQGRQVGRRGAGQHRHVVRDRQRAGAGLVAEGRELLGRRADEAQARGGAGGREIGTLAEEAVAGVQRVAAHAARRVDHGGDVEVGLRPAARQRDRFVGEAHVQRVHVVGGMRGDGRDAEVARGPGDADRDLGAVGDEEFHSPSTCLAMMLRWISLLPP